jgi:hypothetical protein
MAEKKGVRLLSYSFFYACLFRCSSTKVFRKIEVQIDHELNTECLVTLSNTSALFPPETKLLITEGLSLFLKLF